MLNNDKPAIFLSFVHNQVLIQHNGKKKEYSALEFITDKTLKKAAQ